ncbi:hypothetical protein UCRPC4_g03989 [Phaeomoniella chlamydospora]|uniref:P-loop containing nucleoside triphosphate hydrolase protein n=1 Tax=Phaeomoniella chlamydospora TaxID=158046 RepID=A0A0G2EDE5_PHACM|nr:hypothetical protein UCRPC4_g03989 [Phaeomoniella chlamydospora]
MSTRFADDEEARVASGFSESTFKTIFDRIEREGSEGKRLFIKDIIHYLVPPKGQPPMIAPSLEAFRHGVGTPSGTNGTTNGTSKNVELYPWSTPAEPGNPTVVPQRLMERFHWMFLIRDPHKSIPSYYRCTIPPLDKLTGFYEFYPSEAGYIEVRLVFDYLRSIGAVGPRFAEDKCNKNDTNGAHVNGNTWHTESAEICVLDADDMLDSPPEHIEAVCKSIGVPYTPGMLNWDNPEDQRIAKEAFEKWTGFHEDAIDSCSLHGRDQKHTEQPPKREEQWDQEWQEKYGEKGAKIIRQTVDACMDDYLYMKQFTLQL